MNERLKRAAVVSALLLSGCYCLFEGINSSDAAFAQVKKKPAKPGGQPKQSGPNLNTPEINGYLSRLRDKLDQNWDLPDGKNKVTITASLGPDGVANDIGVTSAPANQSAEQAANEAFAKAQPMETLPISPGSKVKLTLVFDSFADPHGDTNRNINTRLDPIMEPKTDQ